MKRDDDSATLDLLVLWYRHEKQQSWVQGYPVECPTTSGYRASRQYDDANGAQETDMRGRMAIAVGHVVQSIATPYRWALYEVAANRATGVDVWRNPRLPHDKAERDAITEKALAMFANLI
jgi:hypothetical protein